VFLYSFSKFHFYADDLQIYLSEDRKDLDEMISTLNEDLAAISQWSADNGLLLSPRKSQAIVISNSAVGMVLPSLFLGIRRRFHGVMPLLTWGWLSMVVRLRSRVYATLHRVRLLEFLTPKRVKLKLCKALLLPCFFYCNVVFSHLSSVDSRRLQVAFNNCTRYMFLYDFRVLSFFFKLILILTQRPGY
jgi:hypothetical protein